MGRPRYSSFIRILARKGDILMDCPYPEKIIDEASGVEVSNPEYVAFEAGRKEGFIEGQTNRGHNDAILRAVKAAYDKGREEGRKGGYDEGRVYGQSEGKLGQSLESYELGEKAGKQEVVEWVMNYHQGLLVGQDIQTVAANNCKYGATSHLLMPLLDWQAKLKEWLPEEKK